ncbi:recombinase family protein [Saccharopolyspora sp. NPDC000995]
MPARQLTTVTTIMNPPKIRDGRAVAYYRVSNSGQKNELTCQVGCVVEECSTRGISLDATVTEVGSGSNGTRTKLRKLLADPGITHPDRSRAPRQACAVRCGAPRSRPISNRS